jgi:hypothetical protein
MHVERERAFFLGNAPALQGASAAGLVCEGLDIEAEGEQARRTSLSCACWG